MTVYADVLFLVNLYVDFFLLWCDDRVLRLQTGVWRLLGGALTGALCSLACLLPGQPAWASFLWGGISAVLTAGAAFLPRPPRIFLQASLCLWGLSLLLAGLCLFLIQWAAPGKYGGSGPCGVSGPLPFSPVWGHRGRLRAFLAVSKALPAGRPGGPDLPPAPGTGGQTGDSLGPGGHGEHPAGTLFWPAGDCLSGGSLGGLGPAWVGNSLAGGTA